MPGSRTSVLTTLLILGAAGCFAPEPAGSDAAKETSLPLLPFSYPHRFPAHAETFNLTIPATRESPMSSTKGCISILPAARAPIVSIAGLAETRPDRSDVSQLRVIVHDDSGAAIASSVGPSPFRFDFPGLGTQRTMLQIRAESEETTESDMPISIVLDVLASYNGTQRPRFELATCST